jgi:hypothetical protein
VTDELPSRVSHVEYRVTQLETTVNAVTAEMRNRSHDLAGKLQEAVGDIERHDILIGVFERGFEKVSTAVASHGTGLSKGVGAVIALTLIISVLGLVATIYGALK